MCIRPARFIAATSMLSESEHHERRNDMKRRRSAIDWEDLRTRSLNPGGFGSDRVRLWTKLLNVVTPTIPQGEKDLSTITPPDTPPHHDERQIGLDTDRSFVLYPVDPKYDKEALQADLRELLVSLFRKRPRLSYFQGYHDISTVLFLTMPEELRLPCIEKLSLHRLRDSMGAGLEPVLGLLRVAKNLIRLKDRAYADILERNSPLPFHALSNLLTLFSHDVPTLPLIQHVFDYLLCRPPITIVYLATVIILSRKQDVLRMEEEGDDGMVHSLLSGFPNLSDGDEPMQPIGPDRSVPASDSAEESLLSSTSDPGNIALNLDCIVSLPDPEKEQCEIAGDLDRDNISLDNGIGSARKHCLAPTNDPTATSENNTAAEAAFHPSIELPSASEANGVTLDCPDKIRSDPLSVSRSPSRDGRKSSAPNGVDISGDENLPVSNAVQPPCLEPTRTAFPRSRQDGEDEQQSHFRPQRSISLPDLLREADALYAQFPPSHPGLRLSSIMGPQSVIFTWSESFSELPSDKEAEAMVQHPNLIVYPYVDIEQEEESSESSEYGEEVKSRWRQKGKEAGIAKLKKKQPKKAHKEAGLKRLAYPQVDKGTAVAGAVLVVGVAVAVYGIKTRSGNTSGLFLSFANTHGHAAAQTQDWKRVGGWMSGALTTMGEKVVHAFNGLNISNK